MSAYQMDSMWNTFRFVRLNQQQGTLVFVLHSHIEFYYTTSARKLSFDLTELMDIDESRVNEANTCRIALKPPTGLQPDVPLVLKLTFESALSYDRFIRLLIRSQVFYYHKTEAPNGGRGGRGWLSSLRRYNLSSNDTHSSLSRGGIPSDHPNFLKLMPARTEQLRNYLHLLNGWKETKTI